MSGGKRFGKTGEEIAGHYLKRKGFRLIDRNFRCRRFGEIDLVAIQGRTLVFIEVKCRKNKHYGEPFEAVNEKKRHKLRLIAGHYLQRNPEARRMPARFDVVSIYDPYDGELEIKHIENAFC